MRDDFGSIWSRVLDGDHDAWRLLVSDLASLVFAVSRRAGLSRADAEDCSQQVWLSLYKARLQIRDPACLPAWLIQVANRTASRMVRAKAHKVSELNDDFRSSSGPSPDEQVLNLERNAYIKMGMGRLGSRCKKLLEAVFYAPPDHTYADIAKKLNMPLNSLGPTRSRCLAKLRAILEEMGY